MTLAPGSRLGAYEILSAIGAGGMGEVYRARDTKLNRYVALKILPQAFAVDPDRLARFRREAQVLASLNHPNIAAIYGFEDSGSTHALVLELVEGPTLAERIAQGPIPLDEALPIAKQIAEALEAAHEQGIIHRDLKPANIKLTADDQVKVLDFGLAKAMEPPAGSSPSVSMSTTITTPAMTHAGVILGTAAYMSPEQARGKVVDKRTDIWAFGCVLFEMLTRKRAFEGKDIGDTLAAVIKEEPRLDAVAAKMRPLVQRCLEKDPKKRLRDIGDIGLLMDRSLPQTAYIRHLSWLWPAATALLLLTLASVGALIHFREAPPIEQGLRSLRFQIPPPGSTAAQMFTLSSDGQYLAFVAGDGGASRLWIRAMDALEARALEGTDGATYPFWSPDGQALGFFAQGKLKKIPRLGGPVQTLCDAFGGRGGSWNRNGIIVFSPATFSPILRVSSAGGEPQLVTKVSGTDGHRFPAFLPDGTHFLFNGEGGLFVGSLDRTEPVRLLPDATNGLYAPPALPGGSGFLLFRRENRLMAQPFDAAGFRTTGEMFPVAERVSLGSGSTGFGAFSVAANGTLVYRTTGSVASRDLVWVNRNGTRLASVTERGPIDTYYSLSPDEKALALAISSGEDVNNSSNTDIWLQDLVRSVRTRFTFGTEASRGPIWSPDGNQVAFSVSHPGQYSGTIYQQSAAGSGKEELLPRTGVGGLATDWSPDGKFIVFQQILPKTGVDLWLLPLAGDHTPTLYLQTPYNEQQARFSPSSTDGSRWMAYQSNESGRDQIYIRAIPASGAKYQVSTGGGTLPSWRRDGKELFYLSVDQKMMAVPIAIGARLEIGKPQELFTNAPVMYYVPSRDGQRFLVNTVAEQTALAPITVVLNWMEELKRIAPAK